MGRVTVHDLAAEAGVSLATVDRVLNRRPGVRQTTIERVEAASVRLDYRRDVAAANLAKKRLYPICVILPEGDNPFMRTVEDEVKAFARAEPRVEVAVVKVPAFDGERLADVLNSIEASQFIGVVAIATDAPRVRVAIDDLVARGVQVVTLVSDIPSAKRLHYAGIDNIAAGRTAGTSAWPVPREHAGQDCDDRRFHAAARPRRAPLRISSRFCPAIRIWRRCRSLKDATTVASLPNACGRFSPPIPISSASTRWRRAAKASSSPSRKQAGPRTWR